MKVKQRVIKQVLAKNRFTLGLLNKFITIAKQMNCKNDDFYSSNLHKVLEIRSQLMSKDISIKELAELIKNIIGFKGELYFNTEKPDGTMKKLTDVSKLNSLGWKYKMDLESGIKEMYKWYLQ